MRGRILMMTLLFALIGLMYVVLLLFVTLEWRKH